VCALQQSFAVFTSLLLLDRVWRENPWVFGHCDAAPAAMRLEHGRSST
jgi:hypothetical protein